MDEPIDVAYAVDVDPSSRDTNQSSITRLRREPLGGRHPPAIARVPLRGAKGGDEVVVLATQPHAGVLLGVASGDHGRWEVAVENLPVVRCE